MSRPRASSPKRISGKRRPPDSPRARFGWASLAAEIYARVRASKRTMDAEVATVLRSYSLPEEETRTALDTAYDMLRRTEFLEMCARQLPFAPTREAKVALYLLWQKKPATVHLGDAERRAAERAIHTTAAELSRMPLANALSACTPVPLWLCEKWLQTKGEVDTRRLCEAFADEPAVMLRANRLRTTPDALAGRLREMGIQSRAARYAPDGLVVEKRVPLTKTPMFQEGLFERQDEGSQLLSLLCEAKPGMRVVDVCAGAGGKTLHLAAQMKNKGTLYAADVHRSRLRALKARAKRAGVWNLQICELASEDNVLVPLEERVDVLLVDAPCSGTGTLRRAPDIGWRLPPESISRLVATQLEILEQYFGLVKPGGRLVYATCSVLDEEGPEVVERFLARHPEFEVRSPQAILDAQGVQLEAAQYLQLRPDLYDGDGFFAAVLQRPASAGLA